jgi:hypothetical protein
MSALLTRTGDIVTLDGFHQDLLNSMLAVEVPATLTVDHAQRLVARVRGMGAEMAQYGWLLEGFLTDLEGLLAR